jgi:outer membrane receptor protein involved in Fe transport
MKRILPIILVLLLASVAVAQNKGRIIGTITTPEGAVITDAKVTIESDALIARTMSTTTNERGMFRLVLLPVGTFSITFEKDGYKTIEQSGVEVNYDSTVTINKVMTPSDFEEVITITGESPIVDKTSNTLGDKLDIEVLRNAPNSATSSVWDLPNLTAGFTDNSGLGGPEDSGNAFNIDGVNVSDPATGTVFGSMEQVAVEQIDVNLFGANAEYGAFTGASLNVVTKSGGNEFSGEGSYFAQRVDWVSDNTQEYENVTLPTASDVNEFNGALGGPVVVDKVWFFGSYSYEKMETQRQILTGSITQIEDPRRYYGKISARWDDRNITYFSYTKRERWRSHRVWFGGWANNIENSMWEQPTNDYNFIGQHSFVLSDDIILEGRYSKFEGSFDLLPKVMGEMKYELTTGQFMPDSKNSYKTEYVRPRDNALITMSYFNDQWSGNHSMKVGFEYEKSGSFRTFDQRLLDYYWAGVPYYRLDWGAWESDTKIRRLAGFAQDSWSVNDNLTINAGVRYDVTDFSPGSDSNPKGEVPEGESFMTFKDLAPRIGFAYDLTGDGKNVVRGFFGRFYEGVLTGNTEAKTTILPPTIYWYGEAIIPGAGKFTVPSVVGGEFDIVQDISNQYTEGFTFGYERELMPNWAAGITYVYKRDRDMMGTIYPNLTYDSINFSSGSYSGVGYVDYSEGSLEIYKNPQKGDPGVLDDLERTFWSVILELNKRMSDNWSMRANYSFVRHEGTSNNSWSVVQGFSNYSDPNSWVNSRGRLFLERPHQLKISGTYIAPFDIYVTPVFSYLSGTPYTPFVYVGASRNTVNSKPQDGSLRYDNQMNLDLRLDKSFIVADKYRFSLLFDVYNVFNDDAVTSYITTLETSSNYGVPDAVVAARFYQIGVRLIF